MTWHFTWLGLGMPLGLASDSSSGAGRRSRNAQMRRAAARGVALAAALGAAMVSSQPAAEAARVGRRLQADGEGKPPPPPFYTSYAEIEGSGAWVNVLTGAAVLAGAGALGLVALDRKAGKAMGKLLSGDGPNVKSGGEESLTQPGVAAEGGGRAVPKAAMLGAWCASAAGGILSCGAQIVRIYNSKQWCALFDCSCSHG